MADLSFLLEDTTIALVDRAVAAKAHKAKPRKYLGMSEIGDNCTRRLWLKYHLGIREEFSGRMHRLFDTGHIIERRVVRDLRLAGLQVTARQRNYTDFKGKFKGHCDGIVTGLLESSKPHILEIKSASDKNFKLFLKEGMCSNPKYSAQSHLYMHYEGLERTFFVLENKDTSERRQERIHYDKTIALTMMGKARLVIEAKRPPSGISTREDWYVCKFCSLNNEQYCRREW